MIEINMKIEICDSRTPTLGTLSMISLEIDFVNIYYTVTSLIIQQLFIKAYYNT